MLNQYSRNVLGKFLSLYQNTDQISIAILSEIILFTCGINRVLRLVVEPNFSNKIKRTLSNGNLYFYSGKLYQVINDNGWSSISNKPIDNKMYTKVLLVIGNKLSEVEDCYKNELNGNYKISGKYFNYPDCCINSYPSISSSEDQWANTLIKNSGPGPYPCWANRLATGWGGACFSGELFPCSLHCKKAIAIGRKTYNCLLDIGFKKLSREFLKQSLNPLIINKNGKIEKISNFEQYNNIIKFIK